MTDYTCPKCGGHTFDITVTQQVTAAFYSNGEHDLLDDAHGDMEWGDTSEAVCSNCRWSGTLGEALP